MAGLVSVALIGKGHFGIRIRGMEFSNPCFGGRVCLVGAVGLVGGAVGRDYSDIGGYPFEDIVRGGKGGRRMANSAGARVFAAGVAVGQPESPWDRLGDLDRFGVPPNISSTVSSQECDLDQSNEVAGKPDPDTGPCGSDLVRLGGAVLMSGGVLSLSGSVSSSDIDLYCGGTAMATKSSRISTPISIIPLQQLKVTNSQNEKPGSHDMPEFATKYSTVSAAVLAA